MWARDLDEALSNKHTTLLSLPIAVLRAVGDEAAVSPCAELSRR